MADFARRSAADRNRAGRPARSPVVVPAVVIRDIRHRHLVGAGFAFPSAGRHIVGAGRLHGDRHLAVLAHAAVVVRRARDPVAVRVVEAPQMRVAQRAGTAPQALQVDPVGLARLQRHREPVGVARVPDLSRRRAADRNRAGGQRRR